MKHTILKEEKILDEFFQVYKAEVKHDTYGADDNEITATRVALDRGDSVAVLIYEKDTDSFLFTEQYRYPSSRRNCPFILELVAGAVDAGEDPEESGRREVNEEIGYKIGDLELIHEYFPSPGMSAEKVYLYYGEVSSKDQVNDGGGSIKEKEDIKLIKLSRKLTFQKLESTFFNNSITIIGLQWFLLRKSNDQPPTFPSSKRSSK
jgi:ADP-ribose pyrophosphatase